MTRSHLPFRWMGNFKAVAIDYEYYLTLSDKPQSVCLTERQMYVMSVQNTYTAWLTRWYNTEDINQSVVQLIAAEIEDLLMCGCGVPEPSFTDYMNSTSYSSNATTVYNTTYNTWNDAGQTVVSIAPNLDYATGSPVNIDKLMCMAYFLLLKTLVATALELENTTTADKQNITKQLTAVFAGIATAGAAAGAAGYAGAAIIGFFAGPEVIFGFALAAVGTAIATIVTQTDTTVFTDAEAFDEVYCAMVTNAVGVTPDRDVFQGALEPNSFIPGSNAEKLAAVVQPYLADLNTYLQFIQLMSQMYDAVELDLLPDCGCVSIAGFIIFGDVATTTVSRVGNTYTFMGGYIASGGNAFMYFQSSLDGAYVNTPMAYTGLTVSGVTTYDWGSAGGSFNTVPAASAPPPDVSYAGGTTAPGGISNMKIVVTTTLPFQGVKQGV